MADNSVRIIVGIRDEFSRGAMRVTNSLEDIRRRVFSLKSAIAVVGLGAMAKGFIDTAASMDKSLTLLKRIEGSGEEARKSFDWLMNFSDNNSSVAGIATFQESFVKLKIAGLDPVHGSLQDLTDAVAAFGGSSETLSQSTLAIFQMVGKGRLSMQELSQQLGEKIPGAIQIMADKLNLTMPQLTKLVESGSITGNNVKVAIEAMLSGFREKFGGAAKELGTTWNGLMNQLKVAWTLFQQSVMSQGAFQKLKESLAELIAWMKSPQGAAAMQKAGEDIAAGFLKMATALKYVVTHLGEITGAVGSLYSKWDNMPQGLKDFLAAGAAATVITKNPAIGVLTGVGYSMDEYRQRYSDSLAPTADTVRAEIAELQGKIDAARADFAESSKGIGNANINNSFAGWKIEYWSGQIDKLNESLKGLAVQSNVVRKEIPKNLGNTRERMGGGAQDIGGSTAGTTGQPYADFSKLGVNTEQDAAKAQRAVEAFRQAVREINKEFAEATGDKSKEWLAEWEDRFMDLKTKVTEATKYVSASDRNDALAKLAAADKANRAAITSGYKDMVEAAEAVKKFRQDFAALSIEDPREDDRLKMEEKLKNLVELHAKNEQLGITADEAERFRGLQMAQWQKELDRQNLETKRAFYSEYMQIAGEGFAVIEESILQQAQVFRNAKISEEQIARWVEYKKLEYSREWSDGARRALHTYANGATNAAALSEEAFTKTLSTMEDVVNEFANTSKFSFTNMVNSMIADLMRLFLKLQVFGPLAKAAESGDWLGSFSKFVGGLFSGGSSSVGPVEGMTGRAAGGSVKAGRGYRVGEVGMEVFVPGTDGTIIPNSALGASQKASPVVVNVIESPGQGGKQQRRQEGGVTIIDILVEKVKSAIASDVTSGNGVVSTSMEKAYNLNRALGAY